MIYYKIEFYLEQHVGVMMGFMKIVHKHAQYVTFHAKHVLIVIVMMVITIQELLYVKYVHINVLLAIYHRIIV